MYARWGYKPVLDTDGGILPSSFTDHDGTIIYTEGGNVTYKDGDNAQWSDFRTSGSYTSYIVTKHRRGGPLNYNIGKKIFSKK